jgi:hypothetical protein
MGLGENFVQGQNQVERYLVHVLRPGKLGRGKPRPYMKMTESDARILGVKRRICIVLEMRHLLGSSVEKAAWTLLE